MKATTDSEAGIPVGGSGREPVSRAARGTGASVAGALLGAGVMGLVFVSVLEIGFKSPVPGWFYGVLAAGLAVAGLAGVVAGFGRWAAVAAVAGLVLAAGLYRVPWSSRKPFLRDLARVEVGMGEAEVREIMSGYIEGTGWPRIPDAGSPVVGGAAEGGGVPGRREVRVEDVGELTLSDSIVFRHSREPAFNADWGIVQFEGGRVVAVEYLPD